jgi:hypothetical protein
MKPKHDKTPMRTTLQPILDVLDEGLRLYRRGFVPFVLVTAIGVAPLAVIFGLFIYVITSDSVVAALVMLGLALLSLPIGMYVVGAMSRITLALEAGTQPNLREALRMPPLRVAGMGCYGSIFLTVVNALVSILSFACACPLYIVMVMVTFVPFSLSGTNELGEALFGVLMSIIGIGTMLIYGGSFVVSGATFCSLIFSLQPFSQEQLPFGASIQRSLDLTTYRLGQNILAWLCASLVFGAIAIAVTVAIGALLPLPLLLALGEDSLVTQGVSAAAWLIGLTLALPPLPIWMALLYQRRVAMRDGADLGARIAQLEQDA